MEMNKHANIFLDGKTTISVIHRSSVTNHNKFYGNEKKAFFMFYGRKFRENPWNQRHKIQ